MKKILSGMFAAALAAGASSALAQDKPPLKLGGILDMSSLYADITGPGSETAAKMAVEDFGGEVLGRKVEIVTGDHLNKADLSASIARDTGMYLVTPLVVPELAAKYGILPGQLALSRRGNVGCHQSCQKSSYRRSGTCA